MRTLIVPFYIPFHCSSPAIRDTPETSNIKDVEMAGQKVCKQGRDDIK